MLGVARRGAEIPADVEALIATRVADALNRWAARHDAQVTGLAREMTIEVEARAAQPGADAFNRLFEPPAPTPPKGPDAKVWTDAAVTASEKIQQALQKLHEGRIGMSFPEAREEIQKISKIRSGGLEGYFQASGGFRSAEQVGDAKLLMNRHAAAKAAGSAVAALAPLLLEFVGERREAQRRERARSLLRANVRTAAEGVALAYFEGDSDLGVVGWAERVAHLRSAIEDAFRLHDATASELPRTVATLKTQAATVRQALSG